MGDVDAVGKQAELRPNMPFPQVLNVSSWWLRACSPVATGLPAFARELGETGCEPSRLRATCLSLLS